MSHHVRDPHTHVIVCVLMSVELGDAARRGDLAAVRSLIEEQGKDVNEKDQVSLRCHSLNQLTVSSHIRHMHEHISIATDTLH